MLLSTISATFAASWLPYHLLNIIHDYTHKPESHVTLYSLSAWFYGIAMSTVISNPILYGWLNPTLRREIVGFCTSTEEGEQRKSPRRLGAPSQTQAGFDDAKTLIEHECNGGSAGVTTVTTYTNTRENIALKDEGVVVVEETVPDENGVLTTEL